MKFDYVIDDSMVGRVLPPPDGFLVSLEIITPPPGAYAIPDWSPATQRWKTAYLQLRGSGDVQNLFDYNPSQGGHVSNLLVGGQGIAYRGDLRVMCCPRGAVFSITLSDAPIDRNARSAADQNKFFETLMGNVAARGEPVPVPAR